LPINVAHILPVSGTGAVAAATFDSQISWSKAMSNAVWRLGIRRLAAALGQFQRTMPLRSRRRRVALEELEQRLAPAFYAVSAQLEVSRLDAGSDPSPGHAVVFFESGVADYQALVQGLDAGTDAVLLNGSGDGVREMAAFLASRHDLSAIGVVAHGAPGMVALGTATLNVANLGDYAAELATVGSALSSGGEVDLWSCDVAAGPDGETLVRDLAAATGASVAASDAPVGASSLGGTWQLDVRTAGALGQVPFSAFSRGAFHELLDNWSTAGSLATPRDSHAATLLGNGMVLVTGGLDVNFAALATAELFDPNSATWSAAASMATGRSSQTATLLGNGKVLVAGGDHGTPNPLASAELYDPVANTWSSAGNMVTPRAFQTATLLGNGKVLVTGGYGDNGSIASAELYDPTTNSWSSAGSMAAERTYQTATLLSNGKVLVVGGRDNNNAQLASAELYDPTTNSWSRAASMATAREYQTATLLSNGKVLITGGRDENNAPLATAELYDPVSNSWSAAPSMAAPRYLQTASLLSNGKVLVAGGGTPGPTANTEVYDPVNNTWSAGASMATARFIHTATLLGNGEVLVAGGYGTTNLGSTELYSTGGASPSLSTITVAPATVTVGGTSTVTLTARDAAGNPESLGGLSFSFGLGTGTGSGTFSNLTDNNNGTYTATFTATTLGTVTITAMLDGQAITSTLPTITIAAPAPATQLVITKLSPTSVLSGGTVSFTVTAEDSTGHAVAGYTGTVQLTSTDKQATSGGNPLPVTYTFAASDSGAHTFTVALQTAGNQTITVTDAANQFTATTNPITVNVPFSKYVVDLPGGNTIVAGTFFAFTVQATDQFGNPVTNYSGPTSITATTTPADSQSNMPIAGTLNSSGFGVFLASLKIAGSYTITVTAGAFSGTTASFSVVPAPANHFTVVAPASAVTGTPINVSVTALDRFGNVATGYGGQVHFTSSDTAAGLPADATLASGQGTFSVTLKSAGDQTITATDSVATNPTIGGSSGTITTRGLVVSGFTPSPTGFTVTFNKPFNPASVSLWGGTVASPIQDVTLVGDASGPINGSLIIDPTNTSFTFKASAVYLSTFFGSPVLPNDTWHVILVSASGTSGFQDSLGAGLDGANNAGTANYTTKFTTANAAKAILSIPDFARGPTSESSIKVPNDAAAGIPITLSGASSVTDVTFSLTYNPALLAVTGAATGDASAAGSTFTLVAAKSSPGTAVFSFHDDTPQSGTVVLGDIVADVPDSAANLYKAKELLSLGSVTVNGAAFAGTVANGLHVNAYFGDVSGDHASPKPITGVDVAVAQTVAAGGANSPIGLAAFPLVDPAIIGDIGGDASIDATAVSDLAAFTSNLNPPEIPTAFITITANGPDPTLSLQGRMKDEGGRMNRSNDPAHPSSFSLQPSVSVVLDDPHPAGSNGMTEAILALKYDPSVLSLSASDITLGSIPSEGKGWQLNAVVDQATGQIAIELFSMTPIATDQAGSLVNIAFHVLPTASVPVTAVQLVNSVTVNGQGFNTEVADDQGQFTLSPGIDRLETRIGSPTWPRRLGTRPR
jgi:N-acetylneuraminic acid mutarotase